MMALQSQKGKRRPIKIPYHLPYLIPPWIFSHLVWMPTCFQSCLLSCSLIYTNVTVSPPFTLYWGSSLAVFHVVRILSGGGKNTCLLYASLRQDLHGKVPVTHFGFFCAPQVAQSRFLTWMRKQAGKKRNAWTQILSGRNQALKTPICAADTPALWSTRFSLLTHTKLESRFEIALFEQTCIEMFPSHS